MTPRLAYSCNAYLRHGVEEAITRIAALGYRGIELMADAPHLWPAETPHEKIDSVVALLEKHNLSISNVNAFMMNRIGDKRQPYWHPSWIESDPAYRRVRTEHTKAALTLARHLCAPNITTEPGGPLERGMSYSDALDRFITELRPVVAHAEREGVALLIEPEPELLIERFEQYEELLERIDSPMLGLNFDIGHAYCVAQEPSEWIPRMAEHTRHYHIEDIAATRKHAHLIPGEGAINFKATLAAIRATHYDGWITVELYPYIDDPDDAGRRAKAHLQRMIVA